MSKEKILVSNDRIFSRGQGCWNCIHSSSAVAYWTDKRKNDLQIAKNLAGESPKGFEHPEVKNILKRVDTLDHTVAAGALIRCTTGVTAKGLPVGDLTAHNYLCSKWSGAQGASLARDGKLDELPEELQDRIDGTPDDLSKLVGKKLIDN